jgi:hypothetical protein
MRTSLCRSSGITLLAIILFLTSCAGAWIEPIAAYSPAPPSIGDYLASRGCSQAISLVGPGLARTYTRWDPAVPLEGGASFAASFAARYGIAYADRRSPVEVETLVGLYEQVRSAIEADPGLLGLPAGYRLTDQDKTDLFYVAAGRGLAIREILEPLLAQVPVPENPTCPPVPPCPICPACPPASPCPTCPVCQPCQPCPVCPEAEICPVLILSAEAQATLREMDGWLTIGPGRRRLIRRLTAELAGLAGQK